MQKEFIPFSAIQEHAPAGVLVVDSYHPKGFTLSHWRGAPKLAGLHDDTSTGIVLNALKAKLPEVHTHMYVTNNHFDVDGFLGVWSLFYPQLALSYERVLRKAALLGDFRELVLQNGEDFLALILVCWINKVEREEFYAPFASYVPGQREAVLCVEKYRSLLPRFEEVLLAPNDHRQVWEEEYARVLKDYAILRNAYSSVQLQEDIRLLLVETEVPLHYYALFGSSSAADAVLALYSDNRYELEYKYTGWVDTLRPGYPRLSLEPLARQLNELEESGYRWGAEKFTDTGPILRLQDAELSKEQRFDHPYKRPIYSSSIAPEAFKEAVLRFLRTYLSGLPQKGDWTWAEIRSINKQLFGEQA